MVSPRKQARTVASPEVEHARPTGTGAPERDAGMASPLSPSDAMSPCGAVRLNALRKGQCARLEAAMLPCGECDLLEALGLERQCEFEVCKTGDPCIVRVRSTRIGLSARVARELLVMPTVNASARQERRPA